MNYTQEQYDKIYELVQDRLKDTTVSQMMLHYKWFSIASNIHDISITKVILWKIVQDIQGTPE